MKCICGCGNEAEGRSKYHSSACKVRYNRNKSVTETVTSVTNDVTEIEEKLEELKKEQETPVGWSRNPQTGMLVITPSNRCRWSYFVGPK